MLPISNLSVIANETVWINGTEYPMLDVDIIAGEVTSPELLDFNWTISYFSTTKLTLDLTFKNPESIAIITGDKESLELVFYGYFLFYDTTRRGIYPETRIRR